jgi:hypothetical protein
MSAHSAIVPVEPLADAHELPMTLRADVWQQEHGKVWEMGVVRDGVGR